MSIFYAYYEILGPQFGLAIPLIVSAIPTLGSKYYGILLLSNRSPHLTNWEWRLTAHGGEVLIYYGNLCAFYCFKALVTVTSPP